MYKRIIGSTIIMVLTVSQVLFSFPFNLPEVKEAHAPTRTVNNASELQSALNAAQPGDEIVLNNGTYSGQFTNNTFKNNIILPTGANGYACAGVGGCNPAAGGDMSGSGYGMFLTDDDYSGGASTHDNLVQGNLLIGGGRGIFRVMNGVRHTVRDNAFLWSVSGGFTTDHCSDDYNSFINNIGYGSYFLTFPYLPHSYHRYGFALAWS